MKNRQAIACTVFAIVALIAIYGLAIVRRGFSAKDHPSAFEVALARSVRNFSFIVNSWAQASGSLDSFPWRGAGRPTQLSRERRCRWKKTQPAASNPLPVVHPDRSLRR